MVNNVGTPSHVVFHFFFDIIFPKTVEFGLTPVSKKTRFYGRSGLLAVASK